MKFVRLLVLIAGFALATGCAVQEGRRIPGETVLVYEDGKEMRVWACTNGLVSLLPTNSYISECTAPFAIIMAVPGVILDSLFFPFKYGYAKMTYEETE